MLLHKSEKIYGNLHQQTMCLTLTEHLFQQPLQNKKFFAHEIKINRKCMHSVIILCCSSTNLVLQAVYGFPISKQQSCNQEWQELGMCTHACKNTSRSTCNARIRVKKSEFILNGSISCNILQNHSSQKSILQCLNFYLETDKAVLTGIPQGCKCTQKWLDPHSIPAL
jgi:hypothetical protein